MTKPDEAQFMSALAVGDWVAATCGRGQAEMLGKVVQVSSRRFKAAFPAFPGRNGPWTRIFRRTDGRSVGGRQFTWARPKTDTWQHEGLIALSMAGYSGCADADNVLVFDPVHRSVGGRLVVCDHLERTLTSANAITKFLYDRI
jgi:hypothetical protein